MKRGGGAVTAAGAAMRAVYLGVGAAAGLATLLRSFAVSGASAVETAERRGRWSGQGGPKQPWIWVHAASVGEADLAVALVRALAPRCAGLRLVVSSMTATGKARVTAAGDIESRWFPIDFPVFVQRIIDPFPPLLFVAVETEIWPETLRCLARRGVPAAIVNARLSATSLPRYRLALPLLGPLLGGLAKVAARDSEAAARWASLGADPSVIEVTGNMKFDVAAGGTARVEPLFPPDRDRPVVLAASTHDGEEALALGAFSLLRARHPRSVLLLAPRHPQRCAAVLDLVRSKGFAGCLWSEATVGGPLLPKDSDVVVLDRLGLLVRAYAASRGAFVGGSVVEGPGGHNLLEGILAACPLAAGPHLENVGDQAEVLRDCEALGAAQSIDSLANFWCQVIEEPDVFAERTLAARSAVLQRCGAVDATVAALLPLLAKAVRP